MYVTTLCLSIDEVNEKEDSFATEYLLSQIEPATAIICACLVTYRPLFKDVKVCFSRRKSIPESEHRGDLGLAGNPTRNDYLCRRSRGRTALDSEISMTKHSKASSTSLRSAYRRAIEEISAK